MLYVGGTLRLPARCGSSTRRAEGRFNFCTLGGKLVRRDTDLRFIWADGVVVVGEAVDGHADR